MADEQDEERDAAEAAQAALREGIRRAKALVDEARTRIGEAPPEPEPEPEPPNPVG